MSAMFSPMEHNVIRSKSLINEEFHIPIDVNFSTFEFRKALTFLADKSKNNEIYDSTTEKLQNFVNLYGDVFERTQIRFTDTRIIDDYVECLYNITANYQQAFKPEKATLIVKINCEDKYDNLFPDKRPFDTITVRIKLKVISDNFFYYRTGAKHGKKIPRYGGPKI